MSLDASAVLDDIVRTAAIHTKSRVVVAFSGGLDSSVLLHLVASQSRLAVRAIHIDHGLQGAQPEWLAHVRAFCAALGVTLETTALALTPQPGDSIEAVARDARYRALRAACAADELLLLAQHQDDQAETLLLQLLRGAGPAGLAAMPRLAPFGATQLMRPLLDLPRDALEAYAANENVAWFDDPSNADNRFDRNYLRNSIMPGVVARWPGAAKTLARAAGLQSAAMNILNQQAAADARYVNLQAAHLCIARLQTLPVERRANLLRFALSAQRLEPPPSRRLASILAMCANESGRGEVRWANVSVRRYRDTLYLLASLPPEPHEDTQLTVNGDGRVELPGGLGQLNITGSSALEPLGMVVRFRRGGERARDAAGHPSRSLAQWFQARGIPPWERSRTPMLFAGEALVAIGESTLAGECPEAQGLRVEWRR